MKTKKSPTVIPVGSIPRKERELFAYITAKVVMRNRQPSLGLLCLDMGVMKSDVLRMLENLQRFDLIEYRLEPELHITVPQGRTSLRYYGEVN